MKADSGIELAALKVDGGASANNYLMQTQADIINAPVNRPQCVETTAMGAAYLAGLAVGYWANKEEVIKNWAIDRTFTPEISEEKRTEMVTAWNKAVKSSYGWSKDDYSDMASNQCDSAWLAGLRRPFGTGAGAMPYR